MNRAEAPRAPAHACKTTLMLTAASDPAPDSGSVTYGLLNWIKVPTIACLTVFFVKLPSIGAIAPLFFQCRVRFIFLVLMPEVPVMS